MTVLFVEDGADEVLEVVVPQSTVVEVVTAGPQGPPGNFVYADVAAAALAAISSSSTRVTHRW